MAGVWVGVDLGGTNAKAAAISDDGVVLASHAIAHDGDLESDSVIRRLHQCAEASLEEVGLAWSDVLGVGVGAPGSIEDGVVTGASNFPSWQDVPLADSLCKLCGGRPTTLANDADAAAAAELWVGSAAAGGHQDMVFVTLGTGVGVGVVLGGEVVRGATGTIEGGHHIVQAVGGRPCPCGQSGCLEAYCSATSVVKRTEEALAAGSDAASSSALASAGRDGRPPLDNKAIFDAALGGDELAVEIVDETALYLAAGCLNFARIVDPAIIVFRCGQRSIHPLTATRPSRVSQPRELGMLNTWRALQRWRDRRSGWGSAAGHAGEACRRADVDCAADADGVCDGIRRPRRRPDWRGVRCKGGPQAAAACCQAVTAMLCLLPFLCAADSLSCSYWCLPLDTCVWCRMHPSLFEWIHSTRAVLSSCHRNFCSDEPFMPTERSTASHSSYSGPISGLIHGPASGAFVTSSKHFTMSFD